MVVGTIKNVLKITYLDSLAMQMVLNLQRFDVILASNMFGDILSDIGGALVGTIGLLGSAAGVKWIANPFWN